MKTNKKEGRMRNSRETRIPFPAVETVNGAREFVPVHTKPREHDQN